MPLNKKETILYIINQLEKENFKPVIDREYHLKDISKAYEYVIKGEKTGNVLIDIKNEENNTNSNPIKS